MRVLLFLTLILSINGQAQALQGEVKDARSRKPLPFCSVSIKGTSTGCVSNEDGVFSLKAEPSDTLLVSYLGYVSKQVQAKVLIEDRVILLQRKDFSLSEVVINGNDDPIYSQLSRCRNKLASLPRKNSKVYFQLMSELKGKPTEMVECYYNGTVEGPSLTRLDFKNGRFSLAESENGGYFLNVNTSKAIFLLDLLKDEGFFPSSPLQFKIKSLKKKFLVTLEWYDPESKVSQISFKPKNTEVNGFEGECWISGNDELLKMHLKCKDAKVHPFLPFAGGDIRQLDFDITENFAAVKGSMVPQLINFNYGFVYSNVGATYRKDTVVDSVFTVNVEGFMHFYDYQETFELPRYQFSQQLSDYRKILISPYNEGFWNSTSRILHTERQQRALEFLKNNGSKLGWATVRTDENAPDSLVKWELASGKWDAEKRVVLKKPLQGWDNGPFVKDMSAPQVNKYNLKVQLYLDINPTDSVPSHFSATILDLYESFTELPQEPLTDCVFNMYFDLCEIHRRKMEETLSSGKWNLAQVDSIHQAHIMLMDREGREFLHEVQLGKAERQLEWWNKKISKELQIDNIKLFAIRPKEQ